MHKRRKLQVALMIIVAFTFLVSLTTLLLLHSILFLFTMVLTTGFMYHFAFQFEPIYLNKGEKHKENLLHIAILLLVLPFTVMAYSLEILETPGSYLVHGGVILLALFAVVSYMIDYVIITEDGFEARYLTSPKAKSIKFEDIIEIKFNPWANFVNVITKDDKIQLDIMLVDAQSLLNALSNNTPLEMHQVAFDSLGKFYSSLRINHNLIELDYFKKEESE